MTRANKTKADKELKKDIATIKQLSGCVKVDKKTSKKIAEEHNGKYYVKKHL